MGRTPHTHHEKSSPSSHPEPKARGECSPFKFQSTSITPCPFQEHLACPPPSLPPLPPTSLCSPQALGGQACAYRREGKEGASQGSLGGWLPCMWQLSFGDEVFLVFVCRPQIPGTPERISSPG